MEQENQPKNNRIDRGMKSGWGLIFVSIFLLLASLFLLIFFIYTFFVPTNSLNPFPPKIEQVAMIANDISPTQTPTNTIIPPTVTPKPFPEVVPTLESGVLFEVQAGSPISIQHQSGCQNSYIAGSIINLDGDPLKGITVRLSSPNTGESDFFVEVISGSAIQYSTSGYEINLGNLNPEGIQRNIYLQLFLEDGTTASSMITFKTSGNCQNVIIVNFEQIRN